MDTKIKYYLWIALIGSVSLVALSAAVAAWSYRERLDPVSLRSFSVSGEGKVVAVPDVAQFTMSVITQGGKDVVALQTENAGKVNRVIEFVKSSGVEPKDIKTSQYSIEPRYEYHNCGLYGGTCPPPEIVGYTVTQSVAVKIRDFTKINTLLSGVVAQGVNSVSGISFTIDDPTEIQNDARAQAIAQAKEKAAKIAEAGGFSVGRLISVDEYFGGPIYYTNKMYGIGGDTNETQTPQPTIEPGSQEVTVNVTLRYEIR